ncbi:MAG: cell division protein SepF [Candidatus Altiarchaeota archaeon]
MKDWISFPWGKPKAEEKPFDVDEYLKRLNVTESGFIEDDSIKYVKPVKLSQPGSYDKVLKELSKGNIVVLDVGDMMKEDTLQAREQITMIKEHCDAVGGEVGKVSRNKILLLPNGIRIAWDNAGRAEDG